MSDGGLNEHDAYPQDDFTELEDEEFVHLQGEDGAPVVPLERVSVPLLNGQVVEGPFFSYDTDGTPMIEVFDHGGRRVGGRLGEIRSDAAFDDLEETFGPGRFFVAPRNARAKLGGGKTVQIGRSPTRGAARQSEEAASAAQVALRAKDAEIERLLADRNDLRDELKVTRDELRAAQNEVQSLRLKAELAEFKAKMLEKDRPKNLEDIVDSHVKMHETLAAARGRLQTIVGEDDPEQQRSMIGRLADELENLDDVGAAVQRIASINKMLGGGE